MIGHRLPPLFERHRDDVAKLVAEHKSNALALDLSELNQLIPGLPGHLLDVLRETQAWLHSGGSRFSQLRSVYEAAEQSRKGDRARLNSRFGGQQRRADWSAQQHPLAEPLHFRWRNVCRLLNDLEQA